MPPPPKSSALVRLRDAARRSGVPLLARAVDTARVRAEEYTKKLLGDDFEERVAWLRDRYEAMGGDPFGLDPDVAKGAVTVLSFFHRVYFRTESYGLGNIPTQKAILVANHSGQIPIDGAIIGSSLFLDPTPPRVVRAMIEKWAITLPFASTFFNKVGQVVGVPENARRLLNMGELLLVFPEGVRGIAKPFSRRYELQEFGLGFMRLAIETGTPIVPIAVIGAEEQYINLGNLEWAAKLLGIPAFPVVPQILVPGGQLPLPTKYRIYYGEPLSFGGDPRADDNVIRDKVWLVKQCIQDMLNRALAERQRLFT
jgi:1-acyl-sn-glycerol-3-phosphate acyltransferase